MFNHFRSNATSPLYSVLAGYIYILIIASTLYFLGFYESNSFFTWGVPVTLFNHTITEEKYYYALLLLLFFHQLINNWVNSVTYAWIINCVQDPKTTELHYSKSTALGIINLFSLYSELDMIFIVAGIMSQISFFVVIIVANVISCTIINWQYIKAKRGYMEIN